MRDLFQELVETQEMLGYNFDPEEEGEEKALSLAGKAGEFEETDLFRTQANFILRCFKALGWLDVEPRDNFKQYILLPHYSIRILQVLKELCEKRTMEFQRFAFVTYQLLTSEEQDGLQL